MSRSAAVITWLSIAIALASVALTLHRAGLVSVRFGHETREVRRTTCFVDRVFDGGVPVPMPPRCYETTEVEP